MKKKLLALIMGMALTVSAAVPCMAEEASKDEVKVGVSFATLGNEFYSALHDYLLELCEEEGWDVISMDAGGDLQKQVADIEDLTTQDIDVLILNPFVQDGFKDVVQECRDQGIYVVTVDNGVTADTPVNATVLTDNFGNGELVGAWAVEKMGDTPIKAYLISGDPGSEVGQLRRDGLIQGIIEAQLAKHGKTDFEIVYQSYTENWQNEIALQNFEDTAVAYDFNVIISESDNFIYECRDTLEEMGKEDILFLSSADGSKRVLEAIKDGTYNGCTALNNYAKLDEKVVEVVKGLLNGENIGGELLTAPTYIDSENVEEIYDPNWLT